MTTTWLAVDVGTTGTKAAVITAEGDVVRSAYRGYPISTADGGVMEQDARDWWRAVVQTSRELHAADDVDAIVVTGQMQDVVLLDGRGDPVRPVILHSDTRAHREAQEVEAAVGAERLRALTGNAQDATSLLAKLRWLDRHEPGAAGATGHLLLGAGDVVVWNLTGNPGSDTTTASTTGLMDMTTQGPLADSVLDAAGIGGWAHLMPAMRPGGIQAGRLAGDAARALGLRSGIPVYHAPGDTGAATIGAGGDRAGAACLYVGTSGWVATTADQPASAASGVLTLAHPTPDRHIPVALLMTAGANLAWARSTFGGGDYSEVIDAALRRAPGELLYFPYLDGARCPFRDPLARGAFVGLSSRTEAADLHRAVLEGVVFAYRDCLAALTVRPVCAVTLIGGGARSRPWCQLFADILGVTVSVPADAELAGLRGAVMSAQAARGNESRAEDASASRRVTFEPRERDRAHFTGQYERYRDLYPRLRGLFGPHAPSPPA